MVNGSVSRTARRATTIAAQAGMTGSGRQPAGTRTLLKPYTPPQSAVVTAGLIGLGVCLAVLAFLGSTDRATLTWWILIVVIALPFFIDKLLFQRTIDIFEPHSLSALVYLINFAGPVAGTLFGDVQYPLLPYVDLVPGMVQAIVGLPCLYAGVYAVRYLRGDSRVAAPSATPPLSIVTIAIVAVLYCAATLISIMFFWLPLYGGLEGYLAGLYGFGVTDYDLQSLGYQRALLFLATSAFHVTFVKSLDRDERNWWIVWTLVILTGAVSSAAMILVGSRALLLWNLGVPVVIWHYRRRRISLRAGIVGLIGLFAIVVWYTDVIRSPGSVSTSTAGLLADALPFYVGQTGEPHVVADLIDRQPTTLEYQLGTTVLASFMNVIPRAWFPGKPPTAGEIYTRYFHDSLWRSGVAYMGMPWLGELFMNGGPIGVVIGMTVTGLLWGWMYSVFRHSPTPLRSYAYAIAAFSLYFLISRGTLQAVSYPLVWIASGWIALLLAQRRFRLRSDLRRTSSLGAAPTRAVSRELPKA
jgi:hypothetical protein